MILGEPLGRVFERDQPRGGQNPRLAHAAAQPFAVEAALGDQAGLTGQHGTHGRAQSLRQAEHDGIHRSHDLSHLHVHCRGRVEDPRAIHVHLQTALVRAIADFPDDAQRVDGSARHVVGVFDFDQAGGRIVRMRRPDAAPHLFPGEDAVLGGDGPRHAPGEPRHHGQLVIQHVGAGIADHFLAVIGMELDRDGVAHGAGGHE